VHRSEFHTGVYRSMAARVLPAVTVARIVSVSEHRSEDMIPKSCADAAVSRREFMMASVTLEQRKPRTFVAVMRVVMQ